jgi:deazaflavin-dependent oxidoreductase (nitroreductase family)
MHTVSHRRRIPLLYRAYALAPGLVRALAARGGSARRDFTTPPARSNGRLRRILNKVGPTRAAGAVMRTVMMPIDMALLRRTTGRLSVGRALGLPWLLLTTTGARSGQPRQVPLFHVPYADGFAVVGSNFGRARHPGWTANLLRHPRATVTFDGRVLPVTARLASGTEREQIWHLMLAVSPGYQTYAQRSGRELRIFHLQPASEKDQTTQQSPANTRTGSTPMIGVGRKG